MAVIPWSLLGAASGGAGGVGEDVWRMADPEQARKQELFRTHLEKWFAFCKEIGERPADVALAWMLHMPGITAPIIGPRTNAAA